MAKKIQSSLQPSWTQHFFLTQKRFKTMILPHLRMCNFHMFNLLAGVITQYLHFFY